MRRKRIFPTLSDRSIIIVQMHIVDLCLLSFLSPPADGIGVRGIPCKRRLSHKRYACARKCTFPRCLRRRRRRRRERFCSVSLILTPAGAALKRKPAAEQYPIQSDKAALRRQLSRRSRLYSRLRNEKPARAAEHSRLYSRLAAAQTVRSPNKGVTVDTLFCAFF